MLLENETKFLFLWFKKNFFNFEKSCFNYILKMFFHYGYHKISIHFSWSRPKDLKRTLCEIFRVIFTIIMAPVSFGILYQKFDIWLCRVTALFFCVNCFICFASPSSMTNLTLCTLLFYNTKIQLEIWSKKLIKVIFKFILVKK